MVKTTLTGTRVCRDRVKTKTIEKLSSDFKAAKEVECFSGLLSKHYLEAAPWRVFSLTCCFAHEFSVIKVTNFYESKKSNYKWLTLLATFEEECFTSDHSHYIYSLLCRRSRQDFFKMSLISRGDQDPQKVVMRLISGPIFNTTTTPNSEPTIRLICTYVLNFGIDKIFFKLFTLRLQ